MQQNRSHPGGLLFHERKKRLLFFCNTESFPFPEPLLGEKSNGELDEDNIFGISSSIRWGREECAMARTCQIVLQQQFQNGQKPDLRRLAELLCSWEQAEREGQIHG